jgi:hypothetical protein
MGSDSKPLECLFFYFLTKSHQIAPFYGFVTLKDPFNFNEFALPVSVAPGYRTGAELFGYANTTLRRTPVSAVWPASNPNAGDCNLLTLLNDDTIDNTLQTTTPGSGTQLGLKQTQFGVNMVSGCSFQIPPGAFYDCHVLQSHALSVLERGFGETAGEDAIRYVVVAALVWCGSRFWLKMCWKSMQIPPSGREATRFNLLLTATNPLCALMTSQLLTAAHPLCALMTSQLLTTTDLLCALMASQVLVCLRGCFGDL